MEAKMKILGIDPGLRACGYACIDAGTAPERLIEAGIFRTDDNLPIEKRLRQIDTDMRDLLGRLKPNIVAVEELYSHYAHPKTAILMGHARGVILQNCAADGIDVQSFSATRIKKSITGNGRATKQQMQRTIKTLLALPEIPEPHDVADAIAVSICCCNSLHTLTNKL